MASLFVFTACKKEFTIIVQSNNEEYGNVNGGGTYTKGTVVSIEAIAKEGYKFVEWQDKNTENPRNITIKNNATYTATFAPTNNGGGQVSFLFSTSETSKVAFSPGNLQWSATGGGATATTHIVAGGGTAAGTWQFAPNQWNTIGADNANINSNYTGWIDLFGWGTSGYNNKYPYMTSGTNTDYGHANDDILGTNYDWGMYNAIYNPKTNTTDVAGTWRTLTTDEWSYLLETRITSSGVRYAKGEVNRTRGLIIVPDNWESSTYPLNNINTSTAAYISNTIDSVSWVNMENAGCVFLPTTGYRTIQQILNRLDNGDYWSASYNESQYAHYLAFTEGNIFVSRYNNRYCGRAVRLVRDVQ
ncbi:MAG: hypothetical protein J5606_03660 [Bacteroidales bacterium]|nr:hypothetical protein [Bacteroidales bacterium]